MISWYFLILQTDFFKSLNFFIPNKKAKICFLYTFVRNSIKKNWTQNLK